MNDPLVGDEYQAFKNTKRIRFWRFFFFGTIILFLLTISAIVLKRSSFFNNFSSEDYIARIHIEGMIANETDYAKRLASLKTDTNLKAVILFIDSPGGTTVDSELLYDTLRDIGQNVPIVSQMHNLAASGGYITALAGDHIIARGGTITGSIGVILEAPHFEKLLEGIGIGVNQIKSSPIKGEPSYHKAISPEAKENLEAMVHDSYLWFTDLVKQRRPNMTPAQFTKATNGSVFSGRQAIKLSLIDSLGGEKKGLEWLTKNHNINKDLRIIDIKKQEESLENVLSEMFSTQNQNILTNFIKKLTGSRLSIDGLKSVWQSGAGI